MHQHTVVAVVVVVVAAIGCAPLEGMMPVEARFAEAGPWDVASEVVSTPAGTPFQLYRPSMPLEDMPIIVWANGTIANPANYVGIHAHLASHGFVVIDSFSETMGTGVEVAASVRFLMAENERPTSELFHRLDLDRIGAVGHSQGATGVINAQTDFPEGAHIKTVVSVALPALHWCEEKDRYDTSALTSSLLILGGTGDGIVSPAFSNQSALRQLDASLRGALALFDGAGHSAIEGDGTVLRGYLTAWLRMQLANDDVAAEAFLGATPELAVNARWKDVERRRPLL